MELYLLNKEENVIAILENDIYNLNHANKIAEGSDDTGKLNKIWSDVLSFEISSYTAHAPLIETGSKIVMLQNGVLKMFTIYDCVESIQGSLHLKSVTAYNSCIWDLYKTYTDSFEWTSATPGPIFTNIFNGTGWNVTEIYNPVEPVGEPFSISQGNKQAAMDAALTLFELEAIATIEIDPATTQIIKNVAIVEKLGENKRHRFEYRHNIEGLSRQQIETDFYTRLYVFGGTPEGKETPINIAAANGGVPYLVNHEANDRYNAGNKLIDGYIVNEKITNAVALLAWGQKQFKYYDHPKYNYTVDVALFKDKPNLGDTVVIVDFEIDPILTVEARIIETSYGDENNVVVGEFVTVEALTPDIIYKLQAEINNIYGQLNELDPIKQQPTPPTDPKEGTLWLDTSVVPNLLYRWDGAFWVSTFEIAEGAVIISDVEPDNPTNDMLWLDTASIPNTLLRYENGEWIPTLNDIEQVTQAVIQSDQMQTMFNNKADVEELDKYAISEEINETLNEINLTVINQGQSIDNRLTPLESQVGTIEAELLAMPGELALKFAGNAAGINLIRNSIGWANGFRFETIDGEVLKSHAIDFWEYGITNLATAAEFARLTSNENELYGSVWTSQSTTQSAKGYQIVTGLDDGATYTIGALFKRKGNGANEKVVLRVFQLIGSTYTQIGPTIGLTNESDPSDEYKFASFTFEAPNSVIYVQLEINNAIVSNSEITDLMMNTGEFPYSWTPHYQELYSSGIHFNIHGIRVQSGNNYTQMTSNDFSGYVVDNIDGSARRMFSLNGDITEVANLDADDSIVMGLVRVTRYTNGWVFTRNQ